MEKVELTENQVDEIVDALKNGNFEATNDGVHLPDDEKLTCIEVEDFDGEPVSVRASYMEDSPRYGLPDPITNHTIKVLGYTFTGEEEENRYSIDWELQSDIYDMPYEDDDLADYLYDALTDYRERVKFEDGLSVDDIEDEWSEDELRDEIGGYLTHEHYIDVDGDYYGYNDTLEIFLEEFEDLFDDDKKQKILSREYPLLTPTEVIERLINDGIDIW